jgi:hypothetical protein
MRFGRRPTVRGGLAIAAPAAGRFDFRDPIARRQLVDEVIDLATAGMLLGMVLVVVVLDRVVLAYDLSRLEDSAASVDVRFVAASRVPATFFYKPTAALRVAQLSIRPDLPAELRGWLHEVRRQWLNAYLE